MPHHAPCRVTVGFDDDRPDHEDDDGDLRLGDDGTLLLSYWDDEGAVVLVGVEEATGVFACTARSRPRRGTLRREDARTFTGRWEQAGECGTLRVELPDTADEESA